MKMHNNKIEHDTEVYNEKRWGKPWIAKVSFADNKQGDFTFGEWIGDAGYAGLLVLEGLAVGDCVAWGQKDTRAHYPKTPAFAIILEDGSLDEVTRVNAYKRTQGS